MRLPNHNIWKGFSLSLLVFLLFGLAGGEGFMDPDQLKPGMKGVGKAVFQEMEVEEFEVELLGVLKKWRPNGDLILAKLSGGPLEKTGVIAGMSGSPVYIQGKLIGAIAYAWPFATQPIAGITPIGEMLRIPRGGGGWSEASPQRSGGISHLTPLATPVMLSGFSPQVLEEMIPFLKGLGCLPLQAEGQGMEGQEARPQPGSAIGVQLVRGDAEAIAVGTLTYVDGDRIYAFGHSFLNAGGVDFPFTGIHVHSILPSQVISFRFTSSAALWGKINQDTEAGISGLFKEQAKLIPLKINLSLLDSTRDYRFEIVDHKALSAQFFRWASLNALLSSLGNREATLRVYWQIFLKSYPPQEREELFTGLVPSFPLASQLADIIGKIQDNEFERARIEEVTLRVRLEEGRKSAILKELRLDRNIVRPGDKLKVTLFFQPYSAPPFKREVEVLIPPTVPEGEMWVKVGGYDCLRNWEKEKNPYRYTPHNLPQLLEIICQEKGSNMVGVELWSSEAGYSVEGRELPSLPPSALEVMESSPSKGGSGLVKGRRVFDRWLKLGYSISGCQEVSLRVKRFPRRRR
jgi:hypothetical protein